MTHNQKRQTLWTFAITSLALFMVTLDNLVVSTAIPVIRRDLHATLSQLEWTVNAYTLTFAVLLLTGAALGDRFGRRRMFAIGIGIFNQILTFKYRLLVNSFKDEKVKLQVWDRLPFAEREVAGIEMIKSTPEVSKDGLYQRDEKREQEYLSIREQIRPSKPSSFN